jgi:hypothetical protein
MFYPPLQRTGTFPSFQFNSVTQQSTRMLVFQISKITLAHTNIVLYLISFIHPWLRLVAS